MTDLAVPDSLRTTFPHIVDELERAQNLLHSVHSFEDVERVFLRGQGLSPQTYRNYMASVRGFYEFSDGLNPLQLTPAWVESYFDHLKARGKSEATCYTRMAGLKNFCRGVGRVCPFFEDPFKIMGQNLTAKLNARPEKKAVAKAMNAGEAKRVLDYLRSQRSLHSVRDYAISAFLLYSGLRSAELLGLRWRDIEYDDELGVWFASGVGKGNQPFYQEIADSEAVEATRRYFRKQFRRDPRPDEHLFYSAPLPMHSVAPLTYAALYSRIKAIGEKVRGAGVVTRKLAWSPHMFRRTVASILHTNGMPPVAIQHFLRHSSFETTSKHYIDTHEHAKDFILSVHGKQRLERSSEPTT